MASSPSALPGRGAGPDARVMVSVAALVSVCCRQTWNPDAARIDDVPLTRMPNLSLIMDIAFESPRAQRLASDQLGELGSGHWRDGHVRGQFTSVAVDQRDRSGEGLAVGSRQRLLPAQALHRVVAGRHEDRRGTAHDFLSRPAQLLGPGGAGALLARKKASRQ